MDPDDLLAALDPEQRAVAEALQGPVCVLAGAGTGKTRAITHRIAYGVATGGFPGHLLAVTFTTRAAGEFADDCGPSAPALASRLGHVPLGGVAPTQVFWPTVIGGRAPTLLESKPPLLRAAARGLGLSVAGGALRRR